MKPKNGRSAIQVVRQDLGLSQEWLANRVGVDVRTIQRAEAGEVSAKCLKDIAQALGVPVELLQVDWAAAMEEFHRMYSVIKVNPVHHGAQLGALIGTAQAGLFFDAEPNPRPEMNLLVRELQQDLLDCLDVWADLSAASKGSAEEGLQQRLDGLRAGGLVVAAGVHKPEAAAGNALPAPLPAICVYVSSEPRLAMLIEREPVCVF